MKKCINTKYTADFETTTDPNDCRVWAWGICEIGNVDNFTYGNDINTFIQFCQDSKINYELYFHNLKFDGEFIIYWLLTNGFTLIKDKKERKDKTFSCLISDMGQFYTIEIYFEVNKKHVNKVKIIDSLKILSMPVLDVAKSFGLGEYFEKIKEEKIDYDEYREVGHILTKKEVDYLRNDVTVMALALNEMFEENLKKITAGSNALNDYKKIITEQDFNYYFPILEYNTDKQIRKSYRGGFCYVNPVNQDKIVKDLMVLDVNSLYPSPCQLCIMKCFLLDFLYGMRENMKKINLDLYIFKKFHVLMI